MPKLDGVAVMERRKQLTPPHGYLSVLVLTGDTSRQAQRRALAMGAKDFLTKPFEITEVLLRINIQTCSACFENRNQQRRHSP